MDITLQSELHIGYRALSLGSLLLRAHLEQIVGLPEHADAPHHHERLLHWVEEEGIDEHLTPEETALLIAPLDGWTRQELINVSWHTEACGVILWALGLVAIIPPYDVTFTPATVLRPMRIMQPSGDFFKAIALRPVSHVTHAREAAELWHWRSRTRRVQQMGVTPPDGLTFPEIIAMTAHHACKEGHLSIISDDFKAFNKPYRLLTDGEYATVTSTALERHRGLNWICGYADSWKDTPTDT